MTTEGIVRAQDGTSISYSVAGQGPWLILSNSLATDQSMWSPQFPDLSARFTVLRYDTRGHGESGLPPGPYQLDDLGNDVIGLLDALCIEQVRYFGISMGGRVGQNIALRFPHRLASLGLVTTTVASHEEELADRRDRMASVRREGIAKICKLA